MGPQFKRKIHWSTVDRGCLSESGWVRTHGLPPPFLWRGDEGWRARQRPCGQARSTVPALYRAAVLCYRHPFALRRLGTAGCSSRALLIRRLCAAHSVRALCGHDAQNRRELWKGAEPNFRSRAPPGAKDAVVLVGRRGSLAMHPDNDGADGTHDHCGHARPPNASPGRLPARPLPSRPPRGPHDMLPDALRERLGVAHSGRSAVIFLSCMSPSGMVQLDRDGRRCLL